MCYLCDVLTLSMHWLGELHGNHRQTAHHRSQVREEGIRTLVVVSPGSEETAGDGEDAKETHLLTGSQWY